MQTPRLHLGPTQWESAFSQALQDSHAWKGREACSSQTKMLTPRLCCSLHFCSTFVHIWGPFRTASNVYLLHIIFPSYSVDLAHQHSTNRMLHYEGHLYLHLTLSTWQQGNGLCFSNQHYMQWLASNAECGYTGVGKLNALSALKKFK